MTYSLVKAPGARVLPCSWLWGFAAWAVLSTSLVAQPTAFSTAGGTLIEIDVTTGDWSEIGPTAANCCSSLTSGPGSRLWGIEIVGSESRLYAIDRGTGATTTLASFPVLATDLELTAEGRLWLAAGPTLYLADPAAGTVEAMATHDRDWVALASRGEQLYGLTESPSVVQIDALGNLVPLFDFSFDQAILDASFDASGDLRFLSLGGGIISVVPHGFYRLDLNTGEVTETFFQSYHFTELLARMSSMTMRGSNSVVAIPALDSLSLVALAVLLGLCGVVFYRNDGFF